MDVNVTEINAWLKDKYGMFDSSNQNFRVVYSEDQVEKRLGNWLTRTTEGLIVEPYRDVVEVKKYGYIDHKYILERIIPIEAFGRDDAVVKVSYEPIWTFRDANDNALVPKISVCHYVIETLLENVAKRYGVKYKHPYSDPKIADDVRRAELDKTYEELYGNETDVTTAMSQNRAVSVPEMPKKETIQ